MTAPTEITREAIVNKKAELKAAVDSQPDLANLLDSLSRNSKSLDMAYENLARRVLRGEWSPDKIDETGLQEPELIRNDSYLRAHRISQEIRMDFINQSRIHGHGHG